MVQQLLDRWWSPEQICHELRRRFLGQPERHLVPETIYQAIYVQGRGGLRRELHRALRTGRAMRRPRRGSTALPARLSTHVRWKDSTTFSWPKRLRRQPSEYSDSLVGSMRPRTMMGKPPNYSVRPNVVPTS